MQENINGRLQEERLDPPKAGTPQAAGIYAGPGLVGGPRRADERQP